MAARELSDRLTDPAPLLCRLLQDPCPEVRIEAARLLEDLGETRAVPHLLRSFPAVSPGLALRTLAWTTLHITLLAQALTTGPFTGILALGWLLGTPFSIRLEEDWLMCLRARHTLSLARALCRLAQGSDLKLRRLIASRLRLQSAIPMVLSREDRVGLRELAAGIESGIDKAPEGRRRRAQRNVADLQAADAVEVDLEHGQGSHDVEALLREVDRQTDRGPSGERALLALVTCSHEPVAEAAVRGLGQVGGAAAVFPLEALYRSHFPYGSASSVAAANRAVVAHIVIAGLLVAWAVGASPEPRTESVRAVNSTLVMTWLLLLLSRLLPILLQGRPTPPSTGRIKILQALHAIESRVGAGSSRPFWEPELTEISRDILSHDRNSREFARSTLQRLREVEAAGRTLPIPASAKPRQANLPGAGSPPPSGHEL